MAGSKFLFVYIKDAHRKHSPVVFIPGGGLIAVDI